MVRFLAVAFALAAGLSLGAVPAKADLIANGGFETGDFSGWNVSATFTSVDATGFSGLSSHSGVYFSALGDASATFGSLDQTILDTPGDLLTLSYWLASDGLLPNYFEAFRNGRPLVGSAVNNSGAFPYTHFQFAFDATGTDTLIFLERNPQGYFSLDDVSVIPRQSGDSEPPVITDPAAVPEPSGMLLIGSGLVLVLMLRRNMRV